VEEQADGANAMCQCASESATRRPIAQEETASDSSSSAIVYSSLSSFDSDRQALKFDIQVLALSSSPQPASHTTHSSHGGADVQSEPEANLNTCATVAQSTSTASLDFFYYLERDSIALRSSTLIPLLSLSESSPQSHFSAILLPLYLKDSSFKLPIKYSLSTINSFYYPIPSHFNLDLKFPKELATGTSFHAFAYQPFSIHKVSATGSLNVPIQPQFLFSVSPLFTLQHYNFVSSSSPFYFPRFSFVPSPTVSFSQYHLSLLSFCSYDIIRVS
jgi:hypothetical protein